MRKYYTLIILFLILTQLISCSEFQEPYCSVRGRYKTFEYPENCEEITDYDLLVAEDMNPFRDTSFFDVEHINGTFASGFYITDSLSYANAILYDGFSYRDGTIAKIADIDLTEHCVIAFKTATDMGDDIADLLYVYKDTIHKQYTIHCQYEISGQCRGSGISSMLLVRAVVLPNLPADYSFVVTVKNMNPFN